MTRFVMTIASGAVAAALFAAPALAQKPAAPGSAGEAIHACGIMTREEVKKIVPWNAAADRLKETEEPYGTGTLCSYPGVTIWAGKYSQSRLDGARKISQLVPIPGIGDEAFLQANGSAFVELYVRVGDRMVHVQKGIPFTESFDSVKPSVIALGKALAAKL